MDNNELNKLEALAKAASPGPWKGDRYDGTVKYHLLSAEDNAVIAGDNGNSDSGPYGIVREEDEQYLIAANPAAILELIALARAGLAAPTGQQAEPVARIIGSDTVIGRERRGLEWIKGVNAFDFEPGTKLYAASVSAAPDALTADLMAIAASIEADGLAKTADELRALATRLAAPTAPQSQQEGAGEVDAPRLKALHAAVAAIYFDDSSDFRSALGSVVRHLDPALAGDLLGSPKAAYDKVCAALSASTPAVKE